MLREERVYFKGMAGPNQHVPIGTRRDPEDAGLRKVEYKIG